MKRKVKTIETLKTEGFKIDFPICYRGDRRSPNGSFKHYLVDSVLGKEVEVFRTKDADRGTVEIMYSGERFRDIPIYLFEGKMDLTKIPKPKKKYFNFSERGQVNHVKGVGFTFPCSFDSLTEKEAREVASFILKVTR